MNKQRLSILNVIYYTLLNREVDPSGIHSYYKFTNNLSNIYKIITILKQSEEFKNKDISEKHRRESIIHSIYHFCLYRNSDESGLKTYYKYTNSKEGISKLIQIIMKSDEYKKNIINNTQNIPLYLFPDGNTPVNIGNRNSVISYDLFDTLVFRYCKEPEHIFDIIEKKLGEPFFKKRRMHAEHIAYQTIHNSTIDDIYKTMKELYEYNESTIEYYKKIEIETEIENIYPNNELFLQLKETDIIISDMYLKKEHLIKILHKCIQHNKENHNIYHIDINKIKIYVSSGGKHKGWIWKDVKEKHNILFHIGDNQLSDVTMANENGIKGVYYKGTPWSKTEEYLINNNNRDIACICRYVRLLNPYNINKDPIFFMLYHLQPTINIPILLLTCSFLHNLKKHILFNLRDGYYIKILYDVLYPNDETDYMFSSRHVFYHANQEYINYFNKICKQNSIIFDLQGSGKSYTTFLNNHNDNLFNKPESYYIFWYPWNYTITLDNVNITPIAGLDETHAQIELLNANYLHSTIKLLHNIFYKNKCEFNKKDSNIILNAILITFKMINIIKNININFNSNYIHHIYNNTNLFNFKKNKNGIDLSNYLPNIAHVPSNNLIPLTNIRFNMITFHTCGHPYDNGKNLINEATLFANLYSPMVDNFVVYNSQNCSQENNTFKENYIKSFPEFNTGEHARGNKHGFWKWKAYIIKKHLDKINDGEILVYHDCNILRYSYYTNNIDTFRENVEFIFDITKLDIIIPTERLDLFCKHHVKKMVFDVVGEYNEDYKNFPLLNANRIFIKKTPLSVQFVNEWLEYCNYPELILPETEYDPKLRWNTHDQAILSVLYKKYINEGKIYQNSPGFYLKDKVFSRENIIFYNPVFNSRVKSYGNEDDITSSNDNTDIFFKNNKNIDHLLFSLIINPI